MKKKNILICGSYPEWMAMFYEFLLSEIDILLLEKKIYSQKGLDVKLGENIYNELISFDFKDSINYQVVFKFIHQEIVLKHDPSFDLNLCRFFNHEKSIKNRTKFIDWNEDLPNIFTKLYGELTIGEIGPGKIWGCEKIIFLDAPTKLNFLASNGDSFVEIFVVARTFSDDIALCMDKDGYFYIGISITNELYFGGISRKP